MISHNNLFLHSQNLFQRIQEFMKNSAMKYESQVKCEEHIEDTYNSSSLQEEDHVDGLPCFFLLN